MGWVKPDSLQIGSGGNRILFCLNNDHSGIDLVCHPDGRLRLAVNQWPDRVQNDSSPGKLVVGQWTRFAVTYDATKATDNVSWYFSRPQDEPGPAAVALDRKTTYNVGPRGRRHRPAGDRQLQRDDARLRAGPPIPRPDPPLGNLRQPRQRPRSTIAEGVVRRGRAFGAIGCWLGH